MGFRSECVLVGFWIFAIWWGIDLVDKIEEDSRYNIKNIKKIVQY
jgi:hypothetical protein